MKYIKKFEENNYTEVYWKVSIKKYYYEASIKKIGIIGSIYDYWINVVPKQFKRNEYDEIFIFKDLTNESINSWCWEELDYKFLDHSKYMGEVTLTAEELEDEKTRQESEKYNI